MNKRKIALILTTFLFGYNAIGIWAQNKQFNATIICDGESVNYAYVYNKPKELIIQTDYKGEFSLPVIPNDTLQFRCVGYIDASFVVTSEMMNDTNVKLQVLKQTYALNEVKITGYYSYAAFQQAFLNLKVEKEFKPVFNIKISPVDLASDRMLKFPDDPARFLKGPATGIGGFEIPVGSVTSLFTKSKEIPQKNGIDENNSERFNQLTSPDNIHEYTGLQGDSLKAFMVYLRTQVKIKPEASDYSIMLSVKLAYQNFLSLDSSSPDTLIVK